MSSSTVTAFNAAASLMGYLYQVRLALLWALRQSKKGDYAVSIETLDDVTFTQSENPITVLQAKHSIKSVSELTDYSPELWKTLRIWITGANTGEIPQSVSKFLISTGAAKDGTACDALTSDAGTRDVKAACARLREVASSSSNESLKDAFQLFLEMNEQARQELVAKIYVVPDQSNVASIDGNLKDELYFVSMHQPEQAQQMLEGWWFRRVIGELVKPSGGIPRAEIEAAIADIQESLQPGHLPIDADIEALMVALDQLPEFSNQLFYKQIEIVGASRERIRNAITAYLQAFRQRSAWVRNKLMFDADLKKYDFLLMDEWRLLRDQLCDELGEGAGEEELRKVGRAVLKWAEDAVVPIRSGVSVPWVCRGSLHMLADDRKVGWHPEFEARLSALLEEGQSKR